MTYMVKEIFYTLQGEGANSGRPAVFCRFAGCNLWSGREEDRATAVCRFCDTDFVGTDGIGGGRFQSADELAHAIAATWPLSAAQRARRFMVCTGGEPLLQLDTLLIQALHRVGFEIAIETNGTCIPPPDIDWICVSPKAGTNLVIQAGHELKLVFPQAGAEPERFEHLDFQHFFLQPMDGPQREEHTQMAIRYCLAHPQWRLSLQTHKLIGIP
jgi:7-carboxy-7-deazaguanine synthase